MSLASSVRRTVKTARRVCGVEVEVQHEHGVTRNAAGRITYLHTETRRAVVEPVTQTFRDAGGASRVSKATITFLYPVLVDAADKITMPNGESGPILRISEGLADPENPDGGGFLTELLLG